MSEPKYKRIMLKISGEAMAGDKGFGLDQPTINAIAQKIKDCYDMGVEISIVVGGGNFWRGRTGEGMDQLGVEGRVQTAIEMRQIAEPYIRLKAGRHLQKGRVVIFACGTGNPFFSTDTAAALRAAEVGAEVILLAKKVDGVYDSDPNINPNAKKYSKLSFIDVLNQQLGVMDSTATSLCMDNDISILVFGLDDPENIKRAVMGEEIGTLVSRQA